MDASRRIMSIDKSSPIPIYHQISTSLRNRIMNNEWKLEEKIPSESELTEQYEVSRVTLRQALADLEKDGIISKVRGKGIYIQSIPKPVIHDFNLPATLGAKLEKKGITFDVELLESRFCGAISFINEALQLGPEQDLVFIKRLFIQDGRPIALNRSWIAKHLVPDIVEAGLINNRLSTTLSSRYHLDPVRIQNIIESARPTTPDVNLLKILYDTPVMIVSSISFTSENNPLEYSTTIWVGDRVKFHFNVDNSSHPPSRADEL